MGVYCASSYDCREFARPLRQSLGISVIPLVTPLQLSVLFTVGLRQRQFISAEYISLGDLKMSLFPLPSHLVVAVSAVMDHFILTSSVEGGEGAQAHVSKPCALILQDLRQWIKTANIAFPDCCKKWLLTHCCSLFYPRAHTCTYRLCVHIV